MIDCRKFERSMQRLVAEEIRPQELVELLAHTEDCPACEALFDLHHDLGDPRFELEEADREGLLGVRRAVLREIRQAPAASPRPAVRWRPALALPAAAALLALAFLAGRAVSPPELVSQLDVAALEAGGLSAAADSPFVFANVRVRELEGGRVSLSFDASRHVDLVRAPDDPLVAQVLVQAMLQDEAMSTRLSAVSHVPERDEPLVRDALLVAVREDPALPVRMKALERLAQAPADDRIRAAMLDVVASDESVPMRLRAIDYLTRHDVARPELERALRSGTPSQQFAVYARARDYLGAEGEDR